MARREKYVTIETEGRDKGKQFKLTEMTTAKGEGWAIRLLMALAASGVDLPNTAPEDFSMAVLAQIAFKALAGLSWATAAPLMAEMMDCVQIVPDPKVPFARDLRDDDIEEIGTRFQLRKEVFNLHVDFSKAVAPFISRTEATAK